ncbi:MAG: aminodeoxychorismate synthase component I [Gammaproteobacteria bacterium]|nr:aminodeoxychorismate synthase component I [Gammaproteobacteria bacterium]
MQQAEGRQSDLAFKSYATRIDLVALHQHNPARYPFLLDSTAQANNYARSRYDILMACPQGQLTLDQHGRLQGAELEFSANGFLSALDECWQQERVGSSNQCDLDVPFTGGWFLYLGYELVNEIEPTLSLATDHDSQLPVACATRIPAAIIYDHQKQQTTIVAENKYSSCVEKITSDIETLAQHESKLVNVYADIQEEEPQHYLDSVARVKNYITEGDVFQVNLSRQWHARCDDSTNIAELFKSLAHTNPAPFAGLVSFGEQAILSSSPERLVQIKDRTIETRPIAGTRPRGQGRNKDDELQDELIRHPKERAEHIMLIDLERNDFGRVCVPGTIKVNELMTLESYAHVHHIVSNVQGRLRDDVTPGQVIRAVFPGGTITGCPKVRCMEIIAELEQTPRGPYTGSIGYLNHNGDMDLNILIRTIVIDNKQIKIRAGAGLVADSNAENELEETRIKAKGMLMSLNNGQTAL